ncbi:hypothetical protein GCM10007885_41050 [Methylobacterium gnaphalii]|nr:hypothetical protein GCM10007885_41050 [Methylobacterium gnaphalii]
MTWPTLATEIRQETFGCKSLSLAEKLMTLQAANDREMYREELGRRMRGGECRLWQPGDKVVSRDQAGEMVCYTLKGSGICYWSTATLEAVMDLWRGDSR